MKTRCPLPGMPRKGREDSFWIIEKKIAQQCDFIFDIEFGRGNKNNFNSATLQRIYV